MKTTVANIFKSIATFVTTHTAVAVTTAVAVIVVAVAVPVSVHIARPSSEETSDTSQGILDTSDLAEEATTPDSTEPVESENSETTDTSEGTTEPDDSSDTDNDVGDTSDTVPDETPSDSDEGNDPPETTPKDPDTLKEPVTPPVTTKPQDTTEPQETTKPNDSSKPDEPQRPVAVQQADIKTGISWDGVSPIIYTYPDGTTGTEIKVGATFESLPGRVITVTKYHMPEESSEPKQDLSVCSDCGKKAGDGTNGTCISYWTGGDHVCKNCGTIIPINTCHTCNG